MNTFLGMRKCPKIALVAKSCTFDTVSSYKVFVSYNNQEIWFVFNIPQEKRILMIAERLSSFPLNGRKNKETKNFFEKNISVEFGKLSKSFDGFFIFKAPG